MCNTCVNEAEECIECDGIRVSPPNCDCPDGYYESNADGQIECAECPYECETCDNNKNCL